MISVEFEITKNGYTLRDVLDLPQDHGLTEQQIQSKIEKKFDAWMRNVEINEAKQIISMTMNLDE